jgi:Mannosyl-glycoprotein endo-beta-N-acetylglucosaminidase
MGVITFPAKATDQFVLLTDTMMDLATEFPSLRKTVLAQWALESGWGTSDLAQKHFNYAGMKWRDGMYTVADPIMYNAHDGRVKYCKFANNFKFIEGYWRRLDLINAYDGWRDAATRSPDSFMGYIGPIWLGLSKEQNREYVKKVMDIRRNSFGE